MKKITFLKIFLISFFALVCAIPATSQQFTEYNSSSSLTDPRELTTGDIDGDGFVDILVPEFSGNRITILYGTGDLSSYTQVSYTLDDPTVGGTMKPWAIVVKDINADNQDDIVFSNYANIANATDGVYWMENLGNRTFGSVELIKFHNRCRHIALDNYDPSDAEDELLILGDDAQNNNFQILDVSTTGAATVFTQNTVFQRGLHTSFGDIDGDGTNDLVFSKFGTGTIGGTSELRVRYGSVNYLVNDAISSTSQSNGVRRSVLADLDEDGDLDVAWVDLASTTSYVITSQIEHTTTNDFNQTLNTFLNDQTGSHGYVSIASGDFDMDGVIDLAVVDNATDEILFLENKAMDNVVASSIDFETPVSIGSGNALLWIEVADLDGDGDLDIIATDDGSTPGQGSVKVLANNAVPNTLSTEVVSALDNIQVYAANNKIFVRGIDDAKTLDIFTITGQSVQSVSIERNHDSANLRTLATGIYLAVLTTEKGTKSRHKFFVR